MRTFGAHTVSITSYTHTYLTQNFCQILPCHILRFPVVRVTNLYLVPDSYHVCLYLLIARLRLMCFQICFAFSKCLICIHVRVCPYCPVVYDTFLSGDINSILTEGVSRFSALSQSEIKLMSSG